MQSSWAIARIFGPSAQIAAIDICGYGFVARSAGSSASTSYGQAGSPAMTRYGPLPGKVGGSARIASAWRAIFSRLYGPFDPTGAVHVRSEFSEASRIGPGGVADLACLGDRLAIPADRAGYVVEGCATSFLEFPRSFRAARFLLPLLGYQTFERLQRVGDVGTFRRGERLAEEVLCVF